MADRIKTEASMNVEDALFPKSVPRGSSTVRVPVEARILIVCDDDSNTEGLETVFREAGFVSERAKSITAGCEAAKSGRFPVVVSVPLLHDGSWGRLIDIANHYDLGFEVVLLARTFDLNQWAEALKDGAFDFLDVLYELTKAAEVATGAFRAPLLKRCRPRQEAACSKRVA